MLWYSSPCNPSGSIYSETELRALAEVLEKHTLTSMWSPMRSMNTLIMWAVILVWLRSMSMYDRTITVNGVSKAYAMTGWRIGYIGAPSWIARACNKMQGQVTSGANCIAQRAVITALTEPPSRIQYMVDTFKSRRH
jgi:aspartate aminotransferase